MDVFWCLPLTLLFLHQATSTSDGTEVIGAVGRSVTFRLQSPDGDAAAWSFHDIIVTVKFGNPPEAIFFDVNYKPRLTFPENGSALTISQLRLDDAGTYTAKTSAVKTTFTLHVYRELAVPTVTCAAQNCSAAGCLYTLRCTASGSGSGNVSYGWSGGDLPTSEGPTVLVEEPPPDKPPPPPLTCTARNPVSSRNATITSPAALCAALPGNTTHSPATGSYSSRQVGIVVAVVVGVGVVLALVISVVYCQSKGWRIFNLPTVEAVNAEAREEYTTVYAQVGPSQQARLRSLSTEQQEDPTKTPTPNAETSKTIYFTIRATTQLQMDDEMGDSVSRCWEKDDKTIYLSIS